MTKAKLPFLPLPHSEQCSFSPQWFLFVASSQSGLIQGGVTAEACQYLRINMNHYRNHLRFRLFHISEAFKETSVIFTPCMQISEKMGYSLSIETYSCGYQITSCKPKEVCLNQTFYRSSPFIYYYGMARLYLIKLIFRWEYYATREKIGSHQLLDKGVVINGYLSVIHIISTTTKS